MNNSVFFDWKGQQSLNIEHWHFLDKIAPNNPERSPINHVFIDKAQGFNSHFFVDQEKTTIAQKSKNAYKIQHPKQVKNRGEHP